MLMVVSQQLNLDRNKMTEKKYLETHEWYSLTNKTITIGISDYAQGELGDIVYVTLPEVGQEFIKGDSMVEVEATKTVAEAYAPMDCVITEINPILDSKPEVINTDPCGEGWMVKAEVKNLDDSGMLYQEYESFIS
jgi:glycine cleavage system H protein